MALVDLHLHSNMSDGEYAPAEVVGLAAGAGLRIAALTDHDTMDGVAEALAAAAGINASRAPFAEEPFICLPGIEITTAHAREQHILGYLVDCGAPGFRDFSGRLMALRRERADNVLEYLRKRGVPLSFEQASRSARNGYIGRPQIADALVREGKAGSVREAFQKYLTGSEFRRIPRPKLSAEEGIAQIRAAGGVAVLAHPDSLGLDDAGLASHLRILRGQGLRGLECHYGVYAKERTERYVAMADVLGLAVTGGSDFHGPRVKPGVLIGTGRDGLLDFDDLEVAERLRAVAEKPLQKEGCR